MGIISDALTTSTNDKIATTVLSGTPMDGFFKDWMKDRRFSEIMTRHSFQQDYMFGLLYYNSWDIVRITDKNDSYKGLKTTYGEEWFVSARLVRSTSQTNKHSIVVIYACLKEHTYTHVFCNVYERDDLYDLTALYKNNIETYCRIKYYDFSNAFEIYANEIKTYNYDYQKTNKFGFHVEMKCDCTTYTDELVRNEIISSSYKQKIAFELDLCPMGEIYISPGTDETEISAISAWMRAYIDIYKHYSSE